MGWDREGRGEVEGEGRGKWKREKEEKVRKCEPFFKPYFVPCIQLLRHTEIKDLIFTRFHSWILFLANAQNITEIECQRLVM